MTSFKLKMLALVSMFIDHTGVVLAAVGGSYYLRLVGRLSFPIYAFLIAEGCRHTRNIKKYMFRLGVFAIVSEVPFDLLLFRRPFDMRGQNIFFTLFFGVAAVWLYQCASAKKMPLAIVYACIPPAVLAYLIKTDYGAFGVVAIYVCYVFGRDVSILHTEPENLCETGIPDDFDRYKNRAMQAAALATVMISLYYRNIAVCLWALAAILPIAAYNGRRGYPLKLVFYIAYPAHLMVLICVRYLGSF